ncbi:hypothetical protein OLMES_4327 [Oleiphilus messinensis]|uniref:PD(D/E)XK endonuclease domain-containing protein n=1 Tax=Oleiphilus messinensis TaxID=141451 RepID=A0A1Y0IFQ8_9GAMM|nr:hypothetical protein [Oleiphilus messinensis]ARU58335.1 hypothetical protein OLMES_4327 [Oleiphilus messinensis]
MTNKHTEHSSYREKLLEHLFVGELLKLSWTNGDCEIEVAKPEVDNSGYDVIIESNGVVRHIQLKASYHGGKTSKQKVHVKLGTKPSGCVVWMYFDEETLELGPYLFFGGAPGERLPSIEMAKIAKHSKGDSSGYKAERPNIRELNKSDFTVYKSVSELHAALFGVKA